MISIQNLVKDFGDVSVLKGINTEIGKGEVISIIGPSGCGKSTLLRCLNLLEQPTSGSITVKGIDLLNPDTDAAAVRQNMNMVFQSFNLFAHMTALENLTLAPIKLRGTPKAEAEERGMELLRMVGLAERTHYFPHELSGGQKQRVAIARCMAMDPEIILLDEPTSALDPTMISEVLAVIRKLAQQGLTLLIVTHEMDFARDVSTRVFYMDEGTIYEQGPPEQIFGDPQRERTRAFIHGVRAWSYAISSPDVDLFAMHGEINTFGEKQLLTRQAIYNLQLLSEELIQLFMPQLQEGMNFEFAVEYTEETGALTAWLNMPVGVPNPFEEAQGESAQEDNELSVTLIKNLAASIDYRETDDQVKLTFDVNQEPKEQQGQI